MIGSNTSNKTIVYLTIVVLAAMAIMLGLNMTEIFSQPKNERYIAYNDVRGMAIVHNQIPYTLNFDQQNQVIEYLNLSLPVGKIASNYDKIPMNFSQLIIYRFKAPDITLTPIGYENDDLVFSVPEWKHDGYLKDVSLGNFKNLLAETYDP